MCLCRAVIPNIHWHMGSQAGQVVCCTFLLSLSILLFMVPVYNVGRLATTDDRMPHSRKIAEAPQFGFKDELSQNILDFLDLIFLVF